MADQAVFARVEKKFLISEQQARAMADALRLRFFFMLDFGDPAVQSLYYDTPDFILIRRSIERPNYKEKLRLRAYGQPTIDGKSFVELKKKYQGVVYKRRVELPLKDSVQGLKQGRMPSACGQIGREIDRFVSFYEGLEPKCMILYDRDAWISEKDPDIRITFDRRIRCRFDDLALTAPQTGELLLPEGQVIMEVKIPGVYPLWLTRLLESIGARRVHFSKYGTAYTRYIFQGAAQPAPTQKEAYSIA
ncbi:MAG: polyphosphate polymerase domain-containing protein [Clostridia bacterium]|nr:polyphosphate polymerase domain-containing protein [Clostridia bacterium]